MKKLFSMILALMLCASLPMTALAGEPQDPDPAPTPAVKNSITINESTPNHVYEVYQIFTGDLKLDENGEKILSNIVYGQSYGPQPGEDGKPVSVPEDVLEGIGNTSQSAAAFAKQLVEGNELSNSVGTLVYNGTDAYTSLDEWNLAAGYYIIVDKTDRDPIGDVDNAYSAHIVEVVGDVTMNPKSSTPTVDKEVSDDEGTETEWSDSADHAINETFQFRLTATLPADPNFAAYESYKLIFTDNMSKGITYDGNVVVTVNGNTINPGENGYVIDNNISNGVKGPREWTVTIADLKKAVPGIKLEQGVTVVVTYDAHLNEEAHVSESDETNVTKDTTDANKNTVDLQYSNEPYGEGLGKTPEDTVFVFTYKLNNFKYKQDGTEEPVPLEGAGFTLYDKDGNVVELYEKETGEYYVYDAAKLPGKNPTTPIVSRGDDGRFHIYGLDAGTYVLRETQTPAGYNTCDDITIIISPTHSEADNVAQLELENENSQNLNNDVTNRKGTVLPSTGGIGTTIFYVVGGILVVGAGILLVVRKRMNR